MLGACRSEQVGGPCSEEFDWFSSRYDCREARYGSSSRVMETVAMVVVVVLGIGGGVVALDCDLLVCLFDGLLGYITIAMG